MSLQKGSEFDGILVFDYYYKAKFLDSPARDYDLFFKLNGSLCDSNYLSLLKG